MAILTMLDQWKISSPGWVEALAVGCGMAHRRRKTVKPFYPIPYELNAMDRVVKMLPYIGLPFFCNVCGRLSVATLYRRLLPHPESQLRESVNCLRCGASNRNRQVAALICRSPHAKRKYASLARFAKCERLAVYNTEAARAIHNTLKTMPAGYVCSEYVDDRLESGARSGEVMHQDLMNTSFPDQSFDLVITSDVLEHVSDPWVAFREIHRLLKPEGRHVFTIPFYQDRASTEIRARRNERSEIEHVKEPFYHNDPLRPEGTLVYTIFSIDVLAKLETIGFHTVMYKLHNPLLGIYAQNALVFESFKRA